ncbi:TIM barrel protein [Ruegeria pomeroyi]|uniref:Hydroxypyruvate isomerase, putative n=2 Tax=Ruegeria pomeroyi TaxID=89184 RepID=Q5LQC9_RUEPO|nr:TIM barrel protein [Ruegeria pomeroyi]HCE70603.1 isomerase [Ruegeria sp.]AAV95811.1 hydroxypyruvate isomerase, putative [Ruegeria pomeroyi DSS-3]NVK98863.1 TIM barrel protein [Ruegeria pomeroyi]NVL03153.1 TIM barrel protein [Ruegeria pomeroyi]QWV09384.1 TIM barrel protein [Ruegeria pomeroyi]
MTAFSANLGFLWVDRPLPDAIRAAKAAGFDAVECHWPYETRAEDVKAALDETGLPMLGLNTIRGNPGENGLAALPGREDEAHAAIDQAIRYADAVGAGAVHVMAGFAAGPQARAMFERNLDYATSRTDRTILIEPLNRHDAPGYFLQTTGQAQEIIKSVSAPNLKLMFDCYHVGRTEGDILTRLTELLPLIGHIQFASVPDRGAPDHGELNYAEIFSHISKLGWTTPLGAEFKPRETDEITRWLTSFRSGG